MAEEEAQVPPLAEAPPPAEETNRPILAEEPQPPPAAQETEAPLVPGPTADLQAADAVAAPSSPRPASAPVRPEDAVKRRSSVISVGDGSDSKSDFDLSALMSFDPLQQLVGSLVSSKPNPNPNLTRLQTLTRTLTRSSSSRRSCS